MSSLSTFWAKCATLPSNFEWRESNIERMYSWFIQLCVLAIWLILTTLQRLLGERGLNCCDQLNQKSLLRILFSLLVYSCCVFLFPRFSWQSQVWQGGKLLRDRRMKEYFQTGTSIRLKTIWDQLQSSDERIDSTFSDVTVLLSLTMFLHQVSPDNIFRLIAEFPK